MADETPPPVAEIKTSPLTLVQAESWLQMLVDTDNLTSVMLWGPPGVGKSTIVKAITEKNNLGFIDVRLSQLAPTDLRGLPVPDHKTRTAVWYPPEFLPTEGKGVLFLDEMNMAPPVVQGIAQQLVLDRRVGSYTVPDGWFIWAAGNRKKDLATVFEFSAPLANRFLHLEVTSDIDSFVSYGYREGIDPLILAFIQFRGSSMLHRIGSKEPAWPSPRTWEMADQLRKDRGRFGCSGDIAPAVGTSAAFDFHAFLEHQSNLPDIDAILDGKGASIPFPANLSVRYALMGTLIDYFLQDAKTDPQMRRVQEGLLWAYKAGMVAKPSAKDMIATIVVNTFQALGPANDQAGRKAFLLMAQRSKTDPVAGEVLKFFGYMQNVAKSL